MGRISPLAMIRAYHGSPHKFDQFDLSKIGTGEGAQAYGHGLYFADRENVARSYRDGLSGTNTFVGDELYDYMNPRHYAAKTKYEPWVDDSAALRHLQELHDRWRESGGYPRSLGDADDPGFYAEAMQHFHDPNLPMPEERPAGHMYEVGIHADPASLLDWDKPLTQQSHQVKSGLSQVMSQPGLIRYDQLSQQLEDIASRPAREHALHPEWQDEWDRVKAERDALGFAPSLSLISKPGSRVYHSLQNYLPPEPRDYPMYGSAPTTRGREPEVSGILDQVGIPGIKYLDGGSRAAGDGSSNYVIFNPRIIEILRRYGVLPPTAATAAAMSDQE